MLAKNGLTKFCWLDLRGLGISAIERLCLEEFLLRHDDRSWAVVGTHEPLSHRFLQHASAGGSNKSCIIVMGIGGKPKALLNTEKVKEDGVVVVKRFSGGGTVVLDHNSLWTTWIGRNADFPDLEPFPRPIMKWSAETVFGPAFRQLKEQASQEAGAGRKTLVMESKSCTNDNSGKVLTMPAGVQKDIPDFSLRENDYVLGERKVGGNAQSIVKDGWLHHTSFLWDFDEENMGYLTLPSKRPDYRGDRSHDEFLVKLKDTYEGLKPNHFFTALKGSSQEEFDIETVTLLEAMALVDDKFGSMQNWFDTKCRTKIVELE
jgi:lipoate-protein ligase A